MPRILFVWDSDGGALGHLGYLWGKLRGRSCALCDLSYTGWRPSEQFEACKATSPTPIVALYRDEISPAIARVVDGNFPSIVLDDGDDARVLFGPDEIAAFSDFAALEAALADA